MMKSRRGSRGLSPIFATLILIAIAVIAGIVVYMFTSGTIASMTGQGTAGQEKVAVQGIDVTNEIVLAQNTGSGTVTITSAIVKDANGNIVGTPLGTGGALDAGVLAEIPFTVPVAGPVDATYTVTLVSGKGGSFVSPAFVVPAAAAP